MIRVRMAKELNDEFVDLEFADLEELSRDADLDAAQYEELCAIGYCQWYAGYIDIISTEGRE